MPHSVSSQDSSASRKDDELLPDAPPAEIASENQAGASAGVKLEDLFNDDDDDEFPASSAPDTKHVDSSAPEPAEPAAAPGPQVDTDTMLAFYQRLFPFRYLFQWLNHGIVPSPDFGNREFALTLQNDAYLRYQSYATADLFRKDILKRNPSRFEIGPVYNTNPRDRKTLRGGQMKPISKELVFDIDLTDYDDIRSCCSKANICEKCWAFVTMAMKVVDTALREDFGFEHILWVYSGRRGAHAWVCDPRARSLPDDRRRAIAGYLDVVRGGNSSGKRVNIKRPLHPHMSRSLDILKPYFAQTTLIDQDTFESSEQAQRLLSLLPDKTLNESLRKKWESSPDRASTNKWADIDALAKTGKSSTLNPTTLRDAKQDIVLEYTYPRLDSEVSKKMIHLLKSPFVIHPGTGRVCVPIDARKAEQFDPLSVPTVTELLAEIDAWDAEHPSTNAGPEIAEGEGSVPDSDARGGRKLQDYEKTSLKPYIDYFRSFIAGLLKEERTGKRERTDDATEMKSESMEF
ncbi:prim-pol domain-containing protein [Aspergillus sclerotioniger CBS 115572]|uniref:DNA primase n=1 Tax=Aspergillus sclerotioniger CBS 115572 TaxID=1450535 RepID=A0A317WS82_9EURO|nr:prim-pol domain-containing protein [Aspergillus sclerotioniger CBS 115572]PWY87987.1 prim-pol domain-containing protein [Aspergillus sclerotioniger CBS 115572]